MYTSNSRIPTTAGTLSTNGLLVTAGTTVRISATAWMQATVVSSNGIDIETKTNEGFDNIKVLISKRSEPV
jgi:hypothetical protein